jgi:hypothetical protein
MSRFRSFNSSRYSCDRNIVGGSDLGTPPRSSRWNTSDFGTPGAPEGSFQTTRAALSNIEKAACSDRVRAYETD